MTNISVFKPIQAEVKGGVNGEDILTLPDYVLLDDLDPTKNIAIRTPAKKIAFPLSFDDQKDIDILVKKYEKESNCSGLAAPQIGISKCVIIFAADDPVHKEMAPRFHANYAKDFMD